MITQTATKALDAELKAFDMLNGYQAFLLDYRYSLSNHMASGYFRVGPYGELSGLNYSKHLIYVALTPLIARAGLNGEAANNSDFEIGEIGFCSAGTTCKWQTSNEHEYLALSLSPEALSNAISEVVDISHFELPPKLCFSDSLMRHIIAQITDGMMSTGTVEQLYTDSLFNTLAVQLQKHHTTRKRELPNFHGGLPRYQLRRAIDYIQTHLDQDIKLTDIAQLLGMSQYYFCRLFRQSMGVSPYKYVIQQRVERAKTLLRQPQKMAIAAIALECGFANQSALNKHFRNLIGTTPNTYRKGL